jgi:sugar/nucleoside kinase (ribokinase family)
VLFPQRWPSIRDSCRIMREGWCYADALLAANDLHERAVGDERLSAARPSKERSAPRVIVVLHGRKVMVVAPVGDGAVTYGDYRAPIPMLVKQARGAGDAPVIGISYRN